jgi:hypothetical protein
MKRLPAIILTIVVLLILGATPVAAIGPEENGNFGGNKEPQHPWYYAAGTWYHLGSTTHEITWSTAVFIIPSDQAGNHASLKSPFYIISAEGSRLTLPVPQL